MAKVTLTWKLESKNFDELRKGLDNLGKDDHCKLCALASGPMCIKRSICRAKSHNETYVNVSVDVVETPTIKISDNDIRITEFIC